MHRGSKFSHFYFPFVSNESSQGKSLASLSDSTGRNKFYNLSQQNARA